MNRTIIKSGVLACAAAAVLAPNAFGASAYLDGLANVGPGWSTITMPDGSKCATGCTELKWNYWTVEGSTGSQAAALAWMDANDSPDATLYAYSLGAVGANRARALRPNWKGKIIEVGSPSRPFNGATKAQGGEPLLVVGGGNVEYLSVEGDEAAVRKVKWGGTHTTGYKNRDFSKITPTQVNQYGSNIIDRVYPDPVKFNLFDPSTWGTRSTTVATQTAVSERSAPVDADEQPSRSPSAAERSDTAQTERQQRRQERAAEQRQERQDRAEQRKQRQEARAEARKQRQEARDSAADSGDNNGGGHSDE